MDKDFSQGNWGRGNSGHLHSKRGFASRMACALSLALLLALGVSAQQPDQQQQSQDQQGQAQQQDPPAQSQSQDQPPPPAASAPQDQPPAQQPDQAPPPPPAKKPKYAPQDANRPPYANDYPAPAAGRRHTRRARINMIRTRICRRASKARRVHKVRRTVHLTTETDRMVLRRIALLTTTTEMAGRTPTDGAQNAPYSRNAAPATPPPATLTIPAGTVLSVRINEYLSSDRNQVGDRVTATLQQPVVVNGYVVARRGQMLVGQVEAAQRAGRVTGTSQLGIELTDLTTADGQSRPILTELWKGSGGTSHGADAATIGGTTALGAAIGSIADWGRGAAIGAGAGAAAGIGAVLLTRGRPTVIPPETWLTFRLKDPVTVDTTQSAQAFLPVSQYDYDNYGRRGSRYAGGYAPQGPYAQAPYACGYDAPCYAPPAYAYPYGAYPYAGYPGYYYGYPAVSFGYYGGYYGRWDAGGS